MEKKKEIIYTIGHSKLSLEDFFSLIKQYDINCIIDVRSTPYSQYASQFNKENIKWFLTHNNIEYLFLGNEFGARREEKALYDENGNLDFIKTAESKLFIEGVDRVTKGIEKGYKIALMCTEKDPFDCHRSIMVGRKFSDLGYEIENILHDGTSISQKELETKLLDKYFPGRDQVNLFSILNREDQDEATLVNKAYKCRNLEIAFNLEEWEE